MKHFLIKNCTPNCATLGHRVVRKLAFSVTTDNLSSTSNNPSSKLPLQHMFSDTEMFIFGTSRSLRWLDSCHYGSSCVARSR